MAWKTKTQEPEESLELISEFEITDTEVVRVYKSKFRKNEYINIRRWYRENPKDEELLPGKGFAMKNEDDNYENLADALEKLIPILRSVE